MRVFGAAALAIVIAVSGTAIAQQPGAATQATRAANAAFAERLPLADAQDFEDATRGRLAQIPGGVIKDANGRIVWDATSYAFLAGVAPDTVNPSLWRQSKLNVEHGLFEVVDGIYQLRGYDISVMTLIRGRTGWIVIDPLTTQEAAAAAFALAQATLGPLPVSAVLYTHSHADHFGGVRGVLSAEDVARGVPIIAPEGFTAEAVSENLMAGPHMGRRAQFQFGVGLPRGPAGQVGSGLGQALAAGTIGLIPPTETIGGARASRVIDGVRFEFVNAAHTEAPAEFLFHLPDFKALHMAEVVTSTMHNILTPRGAKVRDALRWSQVIDGALQAFGADTNVVLASHHWPTWGPERSRALLENQRDIYRYVHDQTLRLANNGYTMHEIAEALQEPAFAREDFSVRGYYGTLRHNAQAVYQNYFGWWDAVPANYQPWPPQAAAKRYVAGFGGAEKTLALGRRAFEAGDYRWAATVLNHLVFAEPDDAQARAWLASTYEQLAFQAESGIWRNLYLTGARELREGPPPGAPAASNPEFLAAVPTQALFDTIAVSFNPSKAARTGFTLQFEFPDRDEVLSLEVRTSVLIPRAGERVSAPAATIRMDRAVFDRIIARQTTVQAAVLAGQIGLQGDVTALQAMFAALDQYPGNFNIVTP